MPVVNFEFKAKVADVEMMEGRLKELNPRFVGEDHQTDTYFNVFTGRLKLREGNIENSLIFYERENAVGAKQSNILLYAHQPDKALKEILAKLHGILTIVNKNRRIYFIENVKFHFDRVPGLGTFIEVEAIDNDGTIGLEKLKEQCDEYAAFFAIKPSDYSAQSYSDMLLTSKINI